MEMGRGDLGSCAAGSRGGAASSFSIVQWNLWEAEGAPHKAACQAKWQGPHNRQQRQAVMVGCRGARTWQTACLTAATAAW